MIKDKRGLSAVIVTLIMILLGVFVSGIIWMVVQNVVETGTSQIEFNSNCLAINIEISRVICDQNGDSCNITIERKAGGDEDIEGIKLVYENLENSNPVTQATDLVVNAKRTFEHAPEIVNVTSVKVIPYLLDDFGNTKDCPEPVDVFNDVNIAS